jgi:hypothetical protein
MWSPSAYDSGNSIHSYLRTVKWVVATTLSLSELQKRKNEVAKLPA